MYHGKRVCQEIQDIDNINEQSQQVFRNCIDKYSHKVHFLASCSNIQKTIESIQSRCTIIKIKPMNSNVKKYLNVPFDEGSVIIDVEKKSAAMDAGLKVGDIILSSFEANNKEHRHHHIKTRTLNLKGDAIESREPLFFNSDVPYKFS